MPVRNRSVQLKVLKHFYLICLENPFKKKDSPRLFLYYIVFSLVSPSPPVAGKLILHSCLILVTNDFRTSHTYSITSKPKRLLYTRRTAN